MEELGTNSSLQWVDSVGDFMNYNAKYFFPSVFDHLDYSSGN